MLWRINKILDGKKMGQILKVEMSSVAIPQRLRGEECLDRASSFRIIEDFEPYEKNKLRLEKKKLN